MNYSQLLEHVHLTAMEIFIFLTKEMMAQMEMFYYSKEKKL